MATIDSRGLVDDGSSTLTVAGPITATTSKCSTTTLAGSGSVTIPAAGFYYVPATGSATAGYFTGSVPGPGAYPGANLLVCETFGGFGWCLTGSAFAASKPVFVMPPGISSASFGKLQGTLLSITKGGSVNMISDGYFWLINAGTGSFTLSGNPV